MPAQIADIVERMRSGSAIRFTDLKKVCDHFFGTPRISGSHHVDRTPWPGDPRVNIQRDGSQAKRYQVRQVLRAIDRLEASR